jgi:hypothetical protein
MMRKDRMNMIAHLYNKAHRFMSMHDVTVPKYHRASDNETSY